MAVDRKPQDRFESDRAQADASIRAQLDFIMQNVAHLRKVDRNSRMERAARSFKAIMESGEELTPGQRNYVESIYEATMRGYGLPACNLHVDRKRRSLKFG